MIFLDFTYVFMFSVSMKEVASKFPFDILVCLDCYFFHFVHFLSKTYLSFNF